jgi:alkanesulfonate monooxygenase SsuD/methylene tetrahydromethanopterin reductase-like flavin-dependent oxidoreductase (luciferase family)
MIQFNLRYDLRCPDFCGSSSAQLMNAALEQCVWADKLGFSSVLLSEHHGSDDSYLPSPLVMAAAVAARTERIKIGIFALVAPLHNPLNMAEDLAVVDVISNGRVLPIIAGGYVKSEFDMFEKDLKNRGIAVEETIDVLKKAWSGEQFDYRGMQVRVTPRPVQQPRPPIIMGGASKVAARRAARIADGFMPTTLELYQEYQRESLALGKPKPPPMPESLGLYLHVAEDPDAAWNKIAPHALHEMNAYGKWAESANLYTTYTPIEDPQLLRESGSYPVMTPDELIEVCKNLADNAVINLHPLMGGTPPELAWESLHLIESKVLPALN